MLTPERNRELWLECRDTFKQCKKDGVRFDPYIHLPKEWQAKLPPKEELTLRSGDKVLEISLAEYQDLKDEVCRVQWDNEPEPPRGNGKTPYPCLVYSQHKMIGRDIKKRLQDEREYAKEKSWEQIIGEASS